MTEPHSLKKEDKILNLHLDHYHSISALFILNPNVVFIPLICQLLTNDINLLMHTLIFPELQ